MLTKANVEKILVESGLEATAPDETIRSFLIKQNWNEEEVNSALYVLRENIATHSIKEEAIKNLFRSEDGRLTPQQISEMLGVDIDINKEEIDFVKIKRKSKNMSLVMMMQIIGISLILGNIFLIMTMYLLKVGPFHATLLKL